MSAGGTHQWHRYITTLYSSEVKGIAEAREILMMSYNFQTQHCTSGDLLWRQPGNAKNNRPEKVSELVLCVPDDRTASPVSFGKSPESSSGRISSNCLL